jgi:hypothetical protein
MNGARWDRHRSRPIYQSEWVNFATARCGTVPAAALAKYQLRRAEVTEPRA